MPAGSERVSQQRVSDDRVRISGLSKSFPGTRALSNVSLDLRGGEVHALVGGNGSGKSTLIKILCGVYQGDEGFIEINGVTTPAAATTPAGARVQGIHVVHQDLGVFVDMSIEENLALGSSYERTRSIGGINWRRLRARTRTVLERFEIDADPRSTLSSLSATVRTQVAIARALQDQSDSSRGLLILDEPTASLPKHEVELLLDQLKRYARGGQAILYVSHRLDEILSLADRVSALRDGQLVGTFDAQDITEQLLIELIVGSQVQQHGKPQQSQRQRDVVFSAAGLVAGPLNGVNLSVHQGEVVGIAGLLGSGRSSILRTIAGDMSPRGGHMRLSGSIHAPTSVADAIRSGVALVPENRLMDAVFVDETISTNITLPALSVYFTKGRIAQRRIVEDATVDIATFGVKAPAADALMSTLSGGNQQKVIVARWLRLRPALLLLDEPTQGVDVGARAEIYELVRKATESGAAALVVASDFEELAAVCDRVLVLRHGRIAAELVGVDVTPHRLAQEAIRTDEVTR